MIFFYYKSTYECIVKNIKVFLLVVLSLCFFSFQKNISEITPEEKSDLKEFVNFLFKDNYAYTLFGEKPLSLSGYSRTEKGYDAYVFNKGWKIWNDYLEDKSLNFTLKKYADGDFERVFIINKRATLNIISKNLAKFNEPQLNAQEIFDRMLNNDEFFKAKLDQSVLLGISLGYGSGNAHGFKRVNDLSKFIAQAYSNNEQIEGLDELSQLFVDDYRELYSTQKEPISLTLDEAKNELNELLRNRLAFSLHGSYQILEKCAAPYLFIYSFDDETKHMYISFNHTREVVIEAYKDKDFFEVTINKWMDNK